MSVNSYDKGDVVVVSAAFTDKLNAPVDPTTVTFKVRAPDGSVMTYVFGTDSELVKDSVGNYHVDVSVNLDGYWFYRYESTGTGQAAEEGQFQIKQGFF
jgi:uncharacterized protein YfaS (alpha-2-macroglobulin family)